MASSESPVAAPKLAIPKPTAKVKAAMAALSAVDPVLARLIDVCEPCSLGAKTDRTHFQALVRSIVFQQLAGAAASTIHGRLIVALESYGGVEPDAVLAAPDDDLRGAGLSGAKLASIRDLAHHVETGAVDLDHTAKLDDETMITQLSAVRGIGRWTAEMFLMFQIGRLDVWPTGDLGVRRGFGIAWCGGTDPTPKGLGPLGDRFRPYRSVVAWYCWRVSEAGALPA